MHKHVTYQVDDHATLSKCELNAGLQAVDEDDFDDDDEIVDEEPDVKPVSDGLSLPNAA